LAQLKSAQQCVQADLVVRAALEPPSRRGAFFRFAGWFSHQAANASRWAAIHGGKIILETLDEIYVALLDEGTDVWRPVKAVVLGESFYRIVSENLDPEDELWEFTTGEIVRCEQKKLHRGVCLVAVARKP
jgi:hypothetical protein